MPRALSIEVKLFSIRQLQEFQGQTVPWEVQGYIDDYDLAESAGGFFDLSDWGVVRVSGPDAADYLQRMSTTNFNELKSGQVSYGAFLTGKAHVVGLGMFLHEAEGFQFIVSPSQAAAVAEHVEKFHFGERLEVVDESEQWALFGIWNPSAELRAELGLARREIAALRLHTAMLSGTRFEMWRDGNEHSLWWVRIKRTDALRLLKAFHDSGVGMLGRHLFEFFRIRDAVPQVGSEVHGKEIILETNFDIAVARNKGCYPGQEVVERIFSYGSVNRKLLPVLLENDSTTFPEVPIALLDGEAEIGQVASFATVPGQPTRAVGLAYIRRTHWEKQETFFSTAGKSLAIRIGRGDITKEGNP